jgi:hypothetical protein
MRGKGAPGRVSAIGQTSVVRSTPLTQEPPEAPVPDAEAGGVLSGRDQGQRMWSTPTSSITRRTWLVSLGSICISQPPTVLGGAIEVCDEEVDSGAVDELKVGDVEDDCRVPARERL